CIFFFFFSSRRRHTRFSRDWSSDVCSSDLKVVDLLIEHNLLSDISDIYQLNEKEISALPRMGELSAKNLIAAIQDSLNIALNKRSEERRVGKECRSRWSRKQ